MLRKEEKMLTMITIMLRWEIFPCIISFNLYNTLRGWYHSIAEDTEAHRGFLTSPRSQRQTPLGLTLNSGLVSTVVYCLKGSGPISLEIFLISKTCEIERAQFASQQDRANGVSRV